MGWLCGFGDPGCGPEDIAGVVGLIIAICALGAAIAVALANIRASRYSRPVFDAIEERLRHAEQRADALEIQNAAQAGEMSTLRELVTQTAKVDALRSESGADHLAMTETLHRISESVSKTTASQAITIRLLSAIAEKLGVAIRSGDLE